MQLKFAPHRLCARNVVVVHRQEMPHRGCYCQQYDENCVLAAEISKNIDERKKKFLVSKQRHYYSVRISRTIHSVRCASEEKICNQG